jgi:hypothetical protein
MASTPSNMKNFTQNSYNLVGAPGTSCVKPGSIYTNQYGDLNYFNKTCLDPYSAYAYWYRRFPDQLRYINCYNLPYRDPLLKNRWGYVNGSKNCTPPPNLHYNVYDRGFRYYDTKINAPTKRITLI